MTPVELSRTVLHAVRCAVDAGELAVDGEALPGRVVVEPSRPGGSGDYATNVALQLARPAGRPAPQVAEVIRRRLLDEHGVARVEITGPGFLNLTLDRTAHGDGDRDLVARVLAEGERYGHVEPGSGTPDTPRTPGAPGAHTGPAVELAVPDELRARIVAETVERLLASQGVRTVRATTGTVLRPVPARGVREPAAGDLPAVAALRWALLHPAPHDAPRDPADHLPRREGNPLFRVQYAHARTHALRRNARDLGFSAEPGEWAGADAPAARALSESLASYPRVLTAAAGHRSPDRLARHLVDLADGFLRFQAECPVLPVGDEKPSAAHRARLALAEAAGTVLAGGLTLLGIDAPEHL
ncbi:ArgS-related anticodon-binding protein NrtL [Streptomyces sp. NPDC005955]|uniref:ArgS-related anticodon-binding protein NrtL n=1 Tax=Streptomyces sp. NPDC005955 TaxID=3364738 RepID=UPI00369376B2